MSINNEVVSEITTHLLKSLFPTPIEDEELDSFKSFLNNEQRMVAKFLTFKMLEHLSEFEESNYWSDNHAQLLIYSFLFFCNISNNHGKSLKDSLDHSLEKKLPRELYLKLKEKMNDNTL